MLREGLYTRRLRATKRHREAVLLLEREAVVTRTEVEAASRGKLRAI